MDKGDNIDFFAELRQWKSLKNVKSRKRLFFNVFNSYWNLGWSLAYSSADRLFDEPGAVVIRAQRKERMVAGNYRLPNFGRLSGESKSQKQKIGNSLSPLRLKSSFRNLQTPFHQIGERQMFFRANLQRTFGQELPSTTRRGGPIRWFKICSLSCAIIITSDGYLAGVSAGWLYGFLINQKSMASAIGFSRVSYRAGITDTHIGEAEQMF